MKHALSTHQGPQMDVQKPLIVFDCDYTLWPFDCDKEVIAPFSYMGGGIVDVWSRPANPYPEVRAVFQYIIEHNMSFAIASRNPSADSIAQLLACIIPVDGDKSIWSMLPAGCFHAYSSGTAKAKTAHFKRISQATGRPLSDMVFFDDLPENVQVASSQGVTCVLLGQRTGLTMAAFKCGLEAWSLAKSNQKIEVGTTVKESPNEVQVSVSKGQDGSGADV